MKVSRSAWHYEVVSEGLFWVDGWFPSKSLCKYFWQVVGMVLVGLGSIMLVVSPIVALLTFPFISGSEATLVLFLQLMWALVGGAVLAMIALLAFAGAVSLVFGGGRLILSKALSRSIKTKHPSIVYSYLKAKKDKVCPIIDFEG